MVDDAARMTNHTPKCESFERGRFGHFCRDRTKYDGVADWGCNCWCHR